MDRNRDDRQPLQPMVQRLLANASYYDSKARMDDGLRIIESTKVEAEQISICHSKWQEEGSIDRLSKYECSELARAGYYIHRDRDGYWVCWREKRFRHLWLMVNSQGWNTSSANNVKDAKWKLTGSFTNPVLPYFNGYHITTQDVIREGLTTTLMTMREYVPEEVINTEFFEVIRNVCDEAIEKIELEIQIPSQ